MTLESAFYEFQDLKKYHIYIDGSNIAYFRFNKFKKPVLSDIILSISHLIEDLGFIQNKIHCICDPSLRYHIDKPIEYEALVKDGVIIEAPKVADEFILSFALKHEFCLIVSNDKFRSYLDQLPSREWLEERRVSFMIIGNEVCLSPNIDYNGIKFFLYKEDNTKKNKKNIKKELTTLDVLDKIKETSGEFDLF